MITSKPGQKIKIGLIIVLVVMAACRETAKPYQNNLGIAQAVIAALDTAGYTQVKWTDTLADFGIIAEGKMVQIRYRFRNTGSRPLFITAVAPSCGCTVAAYPREAIMPGDTASVIAGFDSRNHPGTTRKSIRVNTNTTNHMQQVLVFTGRVVEDSAIKRQNEKH